MSRKPHYTKITGIIIGALIGGVVTFSVNFYFNKDKNQRDDNLKIETKLESKVDKDQYDKDISKINKNIILVNTRVDNVKSEILNSLKRDIIYMESRLTNRIDNNYNNTREDIKELRDLVIDIKDKKQDKHFNLVKND